MNKKSLFILFVLISLSLLFVRCNSTDEKDVDVQATVDVAVSSTEQARADIQVTVKPAQDTQLCSEPTKIILVRHGQTNWNALEILQGVANIPLDEIGVAENQAVAQELAGKEVDAIYASPLLRAYDTALAIAAPHGLCVHTRDDLREIGLGIYTGYQGGQIPKETRSAWAADPDFALPSGIPDTTDLIEPVYVEGLWFEGESLNMVKGRSWDTGLRNLAQQHCGENVVVVVHGGIIKIALTQVQGIPVTDYGTFDVPNASQTILEFNPDGSVEVLPTW